MPLLYLFEQLRTPFFDWFFSIITHLGQETAFCVVLIAVLWCLDKKWGYRLFVTYVMGSGLNQILKAIFIIPRPWILDKNFTIVEAARADATGYSFPSGHTQSSTVMFGTLACWLKKWYATVLCALFTVLVALSRMYLGVHTPLDVSVGFFEGIIVLCVVALVFRRAKNERKAYICLLLANIAVCFILLMYASFAPKTGANVPEFDAHSLKSGWTMLSTALALALGWYLDDKYIKYDVKAVWWAQLIKFALGLGLALGIRAGLKPVFTAIAGENAYALDGLRYFLMTLFVTAVWPLTFKFWAKLGKGKTLKA